MKKLITAVLVGIIMVISTPMQSFSRTAENLTTTVFDKKQSDENQSKVLVTRLDELKAMDFSSLSFREKRAVKKEVRTIKRQLNSIEGRGLYLSAGAIIIIVLLLILIF